MLGGAPAAWEVRPCPQTSRCTGHIGTTASAGSSPSPASRCGLSASLQTLFTDLEKRGAVRQAREAVLEDFTVLFGSVPPAVEQQVRQTEAIERLKGWRRAILKAGSAAAAERAVLVG